MMYTDITLLYFVLGAVIFLVILAKVLNRDEGYCHVCKQPLKRIGLSTAVGWLNWSEYFTKYCDNPECARYKLKVKL